MKKILTSVLALAFFVLLTENATAQDKIEKYRGIQGLGYLHTQVTLLIENWGTHPLNHKPMDEHEKEWQEHLQQEIEHDEELVELLFVEEGLVYQLDEMLDPDTEADLEANLEFYREIIHAVSEPEKFTDNLQGWKEELEVAERRLYEDIFPAIIK